MAVIGNIRKRSGLLVIIIGGALAAFVLGDFIKPGSGSRKITNLAVIDGEKVSYNDFLFKVEEQAELRKQQTGQENLSSEDIFQVKEGTWTNMKRDIIMGKEYEELGLALVHDEAIGASISKEEFDDMVFGNNPHSVIIQNFTDPETGQFNQERVSQFLLSVKQMRQDEDAEKREMAEKQWTQWQSIEDYIRADRLSTKYNNLIKKGYYVPQAFVEREYEARNKSVKFRFFAQRYNTMSDSLAVITDKDYEKFYEKHKNEYEQEETRNINYVIFEVNASEKDISIIEGNVKNIHSELQEVKVEDIANFVNRIPDSQYDSSWVKEGTLSLFIDSIMFDSEIGTVVGPYVEDNAYHLSKLIDVQYRPDSMRASHILIAYQGAMRAAENVTKTKEEAEAFADSLLNVIKYNPMKFNEFASTISDDPAAKEQSGDLDWFADGSMVPAFNNFCIRGNVGDLEIVETNFGYHIIQITGKQPPIKKIRVALIDVNIEPSKETYDIVWGKASKFSSNSQNEEDFENSVVEQGLNKRIAEWVKKMDNNIPGIESPREMIQWAFNEEREVGDVSTEKIFEFENKFVVALLKEIREKGISTLEQKKKDIEVLVRRDKKAEMIIEEFNAKLGATKDIYKLASEFNAKVDTLDMITFLTYSLQEYGPEPNVIGSLFSMEKGALSEPIKGEQGVFIVQVDGFVEPQKTEDYSMYKSQMTTTFESRILNQVFQALEKSSDIEDNRISFY